MADRATKGRRPEGVTVRHGRGCAARQGGRCACRPAYQAQVFSPRDRRTIRKTFKTLADARAWRTDTKAALRAQTLRAPTRTTLDQAAEDWLAAARAGIARTRSGDRYKPSALRSYEEALTTKVLPELGPMRLSAIDRGGDPGPGRPPRGPRPRPEHGQKLHPSPAGGLPPRRRAL